ncbi:NAD(P)H-binding protein [Paramicrobacterium fandaimingii]|uniref:NAD(P)H-binding protein n=1 Tax=Paramicrobacterium fandaimingii TaxID=2708079 RepID=UPI001AB02159|nr:NAD(P)H-binding protein [Microbacterium fandaimingii]
MLRKTYANNAASEVLLSDSDAKWTLAYPGSLNASDTTQRTTVMLEKVTKLPLFPSTSRANVAEFVLDTAVDNSFIRQTVVVTDAK